MANPREQKRYQTLISEIGRLFEHGRDESRRSGNHAQTLAFWEIGERITKEELNEDGRAPYGEMLLEKLAEDLTDQYGRGFSRRNLNNMVMLHRTYEKTKINNGLSWSQYRQLMSIAEPALRRELERRAIRENLSFLKLLKLIRLERGRDRILKRPAGILHTYRITERAMLAGRKEKYLDLGFGIYASLPDNAPVDKAHTIYHVSIKNGKTSLSPGRPGDLWLYRARVERIVDADTLIVLAELPYEQHARIRVRLSGVEIPERGTDEEKKTRRYVNSRLKKAKGILIKTRDMDRFGRYVADVLYSTTTNIPEKILKTGQHLNAELIRREQKSGP